MFTPQTSLTRDLIFKFHIREEKYLKTGGDYFMTKIFVGSLPYSMTNQGLSELFESFGKVASATVIMDKFTNQSRGFGFVEMPNDEEAQKAISELNDYEVDGRKLMVSVAKPREDRPRNDNFRNDGPRSGFGGGFDRNRGRR